jgi:hypothetical protein
VIGSSSVSRQSRYRQDSPSIASVVSTVPQGRSWTCRGLDPAPAAQP